MVAKVVPVVNGYPAAVLVNVHVPAEKLQPMPLEQELVVVPTPIHAPLRNASVCPAAPAKSDVVEMAVGAAGPPVRFASTVLAAWVASLVGARVPPMSASVLVAAAYTLPFASTPNPEFESDVSHVVSEFANAVVDAKSKCVVEDALRPLFAQNTEVVAAFTVA